MILIKMRLVKYLLEHKFALFMVVVLFAFQCVFDLMLPNYTAKIVDVGIQQSGIDSSVPDYVSFDSMDGIIAQMNEQDAQYVLNSYTKTDNSYELNSTINNDTNAYSTLESIMRVPFAHLYYSHDDIAQLSDQQIIEAIKLEYEKCAINLVDYQVNYLINVGVLMLLMVLGSCLAHCCMNVFATRTSAQIGRDLRNRLFEKVISFSDAEINRFSAASLITRGTNDIQLIQNLELHFQRMVIYAIFITIGGFYMLSQVNLALAWVIFVAIAIIVIVIGILFAITWPKFKVIQQLIDKVNLIAREMLNGMPVIRAFNRQTYEQDRFTSANTMLKNNQLFTSRAMALMMPVMMMVMNLVAVAIVWLGADYIDAGIMQTGDMIASITYSMVIIGGFLALGMVCIVLPRAGVSAQRIDEVIHTCTSIQDALCVYDCQFDETIGAKIEFKNVVFKYSQDSVPVVNDVSFVAQTGKTTAILGPTGCGKSTLIKLLERFYDVNSGSIEINGIDIRELSQKKLHEILGYIPQKAFLFSGTIQSNVTYGNTSATSAEIQNALDISQAADFVLERKDGLCSPVSQSGSNVSGGQRQRLSIARAFAYNPRVFLFDDSFSALDYKTDANLRRAMSSKLCGKTVIIVGQRIATVMNADNIIVLNEGKIVAQGTHRDLLTNCDMYREIAESQLSEKELSGGVD